MKLAPPQNTLQPLPPDVQPAVSQSVQRTATQADIQTIQNVQTAEQNSAPAYTQNSVLPVIAFAQSSPSDSIALWIALVIAVIVAGAGIWFWRSF